MAAHRSLLLTGLLACCLSLVFGCGSGSSPGDESHDPDDHGEAPLLGPAHLGYKAVHCETCHMLPVEEHATDHSPACATCHGGNGACDPNGLYSLRIHDESDACTTCHGEQHGHVTDGDCTACHFAEVGLDERCGAPVDDPGGGLRPESELEEGCYGWPDTAFTPGNAARLTLGLQAGEPAVEFTLRTPGGTVVALADLLQSRPVALVTGGFT